ncbi:MAG: hypothetical protein AAGM22_33600, partial [Acidobacteriota bacterium]
MRALWEHGFPHDFPDSPASLQDLLIWLLEKNAQVEDRTFPCRDGQSRLQCLQWQWKDQLFFGHLSECEPDGKTLAVPTRTDVKSVKPIEKEPDEGEAFQQGELHFAVSGNNVAYVCSGRMRLNMLSAFLEGVVEQTMERSLGAVMKLKPQLKANAVEAL